MEGVCVASFAPWLPRVRERYPGANIERGGGIQNWCDYCGKEKALLLPGISPQCHVMHPTTPSSSQRRITTQYFYNSSLFSLPQNVEVLLILRSKKYFQSFRAEMNCLKQGEFVLPLIFNFASRMLLGRSNKTCRIEI
jgi:hypothetical protein